MISFEISEFVKQQTAMTQMLAETIMRPLARKYDEEEGAVPWEYIDQMWPLMQAREQMLLASEKKRAEAEAKDGAEAKPLDNGGNGKPKRPSVANMALVHALEAMSWGDAGLYLVTPTSGLGGAAIHAVGTPEQKERFLTRFTEGKPKWGAMAITEPHAGSDTANIKTSARLDEETNEWVLNGQKIFITSGKMAGTIEGGLVVVWATLDPGAGRAGIKSFIVEAGTPGFSVEKTEHKLGIRASDTAVLVFDNCRIPYDNILGSAEVFTKGSKKGFKGVMRTFDASRPSVAASAMGVARAAMEFTFAKLEEQGVEFPTGKPRHQMTHVEYQMVEIKGLYKSAWLLTQRAAWMADQKLPNPVEASMCKAKAGIAVTRITRQCVALLGPPGYSRELLIEKWMRDAKINDLYEGTYQINLLIIARRILGYGRAQLK